jgi:hypothetical protein
VLEYDTSRVIWAGERTKVTVDLFFDERAVQKQRGALQMIFSGKAGGFMAEIAKLIGDVRCIDYAPIRFEVTDDLFILECGDSQKGTC